MYISVGNVNHLFHTDMINRKFNQNTGDGEEKQGIVLRRDISMISQKGKAMSAVERLVKQKDFIKECKVSLPEQSEIMDTVKDRTVGEFVDNIEENVAFDKEEINSIRENLNKIKDIYQIELRQEGRDYFQEQIENDTRAVISSEKIELKKLRQDDEYNYILENSDDGYHRPTMDSQLHGAYMGYLNETFEKGKDPEEDVYEYIVNIHVNILTKAYQDVYRDIVKGYEDGTREVWTQDFEEGADYIEFELEGKNYRFISLQWKKSLPSLTEPMRMLQRM